MSVSAPAADLERSFGPVYTRGELRRGNSAAVLGVNAQETQSVIDASVTFGLLWLDACRKQLAGRAHVEGLKLFVPPGRSAIARERMALLNHQAARFAAVRTGRAPKGRCEPWTSPIAATSPPVWCAHRMSRWSARASRRPSRASRSWRRKPRFACSPRPSWGFRLCGLEFARAQLAQAPGFPQRGRDRLRRRAVSRPR